MTTHRCTGPCNQGRHDCPTPMNCELPEQAEKKKLCRSDYLFGFLFVLFGSVVCGALVAFAQAYAP